MTGDDVPDRNMPNFQWVSRRDAPTISDVSLTALLAGADVPPGPAWELQPLAHVLAELAGQPTSDELQGEAETVAAFRNQFGAPSAAHRPVSKSPLFFRPLPVKAAAAAAATVLSLGGIATAAYAGALPTGLQRLAHDIIGAPIPGTPPAIRPSRADPGATGHRAYGLCAAWAHAKAHGTQEQRTVAFDKLAAAAGGPGNVPAYCARATHPQTSPSQRPHPAPTPHGSGKPTARPTPHGSGKPTARPAPTAQASRPRTPAGEPSSNH